MAFLYAFNPFSGRLDVVQDLTGYLTAETDPLSIHKNGDSTTSAEIPFAVGLSTVYVSSSTALDLFLYGKTGRKVVVGTDNTSNHSLAAINDLLVGGKFEVHSDSYFDYDAYWATTKRAYFRSANNYLYSNAVDELTLYAPTLTTIGAAGDTKLGDSTLRVVHPQTNERIDLGKSSHQFNDIRGKTIYSNGTQVNYPLTVYAAGTAYSLTNTAALLDFGTTDPSLTLGKAGTYLLMAKARIDYNASTFAAVRTVTLKLRRTNNTAADVTNATTSFKVPIMTTLTYTAGIMELPAVIYTTTATTDIIQLFGSIDTVPTAGSIQAVEASIIAIRLY